MGRSRCRIIGSSKARCGSMDFALGDGPDISVCLYQLRVGGGGISRQYGDGDATGYHNGNGQGVGLCAPWYGTALLVTDDPLWLICQENAFMWLDR